MEHGEIKAMMAEIAPVIREYVAASTAPLLARIDALESRAPERGERGEKGDSGELSQFDVSAIETMVTGAAAKAVAEISVLKGDPGPIGPQGDQGAPGESVEIALIETMVVEATRKAVEALPLLKGDPGSPGAQGEPGRPGEAGRDGRDGMSGVPGRDGLDGVSPEIPDAMFAPDEIAGIISKGVKMLAEKAFVGAPAPPPVSPIILNVEASGERRKINKTITTHRDERGNLVADVVETEG